MTRRHSWPKVTGNARERGATALVVGVVTAVVGVATLYYLNLASGNNLNAMKVVQESDNVFTGNLSGLGLASVLLQPKSSPGQPNVPTNTVIMPNIYFDHYFAGTPALQTTPFNNALNQSDADANGWSLNSGTINLSTTRYMAVADRAGLASFYANPTVDATPGTAFGGGTQVSLLNVNRVNGAGANKNLIVSAKVQVTTTNPLTGHSTAKTATIPVSPPPPPSANLFLLDSSGTPLPGMIVSASDSFYVRLVGNGIVDHAQVTTAGGLINNCGVQNAASNSCGGWAADNYSNVNPTCVWQCGFGAIGGGGVADEFSPSPTDTYPVGFTLSGPDGSTVTQPGDQPAIEVMKQPSCSMLFTATALTGIQGVTAHPGDTLWPFVATWGYTYWDWSKNPVDLYLMDSSWNPVPGTSPVELYDTGWNIAGGAVVNDPNSGESQQGVLFNNYNLPAWQPGSTYLYNSNAMAFYIPYVLPGSLAPGTYHFWSAIHGPGAPAGGVTCHQAGGSLTNNAFAVLDITVVANPQPVSCGFWADNNNIMWDQDTNINWNSSNATSCTVNGNPAGTSGAVSANALEGGSWPDSRTFTLSCTNGTYTCPTQQIQVNKTCWCAGGPIRVADIRNSQADAIACKDVIRSWSAWLGNGCNHCATWGTCACNGRTPNQAYPWPNGTQCRCFNPAEGTAGSWITTHTQNYGACAGG